MIKLLKYYTCICVEEYFSGSNFGEFIIVGSTAPSNFDLGYGILGLIIYTYALYIYICFKYFSNCDLAIDMGLVPETIIS